MSLYALRQLGNTFTITKFTDDLNVEGSYTVTPTTCTCPAGPRPSCRHRKMLPRMLAHVNDGWFFCYETQKWHRPVEEVEAGLASAASDLPTIDEAADVDWDKMAEERLEQRHITATEIAALKAKPLEPSPAWQEAERQFLEPALNKMLAVADAVGSEHHSASYGRNPTMNELPAIKAETERRLEELRQREADFIRTYDPTIPVVDRFAGEGPEPSTLAATTRASPSQNVPASAAIHSDRRGEPAPAVQGIRRRV